MHINRFIASATGVSRRSADKLVSDSRVKVNEAVVSAGYSVKPEDVVTLDGKIIKVPNEFKTIILNKPVGYVVSRDGQGSKTIYDLLPKDLHRLNPIGRLDKESSGLLLMTNDGILAQKLMHPSYNKAKVYDIVTDRPLSITDVQAIEKGITLEDGLSHLTLNGKNLSWTVTMYEGRNRQIRRTFSALGYEVVKLHRFQFGGYKLPYDLAAGSYRSVPTQSAI